MIPVITIATMSVLARQLETWIFIWVGEGSLVADDDLGGLDAFGVELVADDLPRADPFHLDHFAGCRGGVGELLVRAPDRCSLVGIELQEVAFREVGGNGRP